MIFCSGSFSNLLLGCRDVLVFGVSLSRPKHGQSVFLGVALSLSSPNAHRESPIEYVSLPIFGVKVGPLWVSWPLATLEKMVPRINLGRNVFKVICLNLVSATVSSSPSKAHGAQRGPKGPRGPEGAPQSISRYVVKVFV